MIFLFRKEIKKWNTIWWFVLASLGLSGASFLFFSGRNDRDSIQVARVNGAPVSLKEFHNSFSELKETFDMYAAMFGKTAEQLISLMGLPNIEKTALEQCIQGKLLDSIVKDLAVNLDQKQFQESLGEALNAKFPDVSGQINMQAYRNSLSRRHLTVSEYEDLKEQEFKQLLVRRFITESDYTPEYAIQLLKKNMEQEKKFAILELPFNSFLTEVKKKKPSEKELQQYYDQNKERYSVAEKRKGRYWVLTPADYEKKIEVDNKSIESFYNKYKSSLFRLPPKVKVRRILLRVNENASPDVMQGVRTKIEAILKEAKAKPKQFASLARRHSQDRETAENGGLLDYFSRGTHDPALERVAFVSLKKKGDISDVVRTKQGLEILFLEDRIPAGVKPLRDVRQEVIKKVKAKKALTSLRSDMSKLVRDARKDKKAIANFTKQNNMKSAETPLSTKADASDYSLDSMVIQKLFDGRKQIAEQGYFVNQGRHVLYMLTKQQKSFVPKLADIRDKVEEDWYTKQAKTLQKETVKAYRRDLISKKANIFELGQKDVVKQPVVSKFVALDGTIPEFEKIKGLVSQAFSLTDQSQVLEYGHNADTYLIRLIASRPAKERRQEKEQIEDKAEELKVREKRLNSEAFIASLQRVATIETFDAMSKKTPL